MNGGHGRVVSDLKVTGKWNARGCRSRTGYLRVATEDGSGGGGGGGDSDGGDGARGRACCSGLREYRQGRCVAASVGSPDAELRSTLYPSELLHTLYVPINTTAESSPILRQLAEARPSKYRPLRFRSIMEMTERNLERSAIADDDDCDGGNREAMIRPVDSGGDSRIDRRTGMPRYTLLIISRQSPR